MELPEGCRSRAAERHVADMPVPFAEGDGCPGPRKKPATTTLQYRTKLERIIRPLGSFTKPTTHYIGRHLVGYDGSSLLDKVHEMFGVAHVHHFVFHFCWWKKRILHSIDSSLQIPERSALLVHSSSLQTQYQRPPLAAE